jgi:ABC-type taurine transport system substrate-binding protein
MRRDRILEANLDKLGLDVVYHPYLKGYDVNFFLRRGDLHVGVGGDMPTLSIAATAQVVIPVMIQSGPTWLTTRVGILSNELEGKRIAYAHGSNAHFMLLNLLSSYGLSAADVDLVPMDVNKMIEAMVREEVFAFAAWEPTASQAVLQHAYVANFGVLSSGYLYFSVDFADEHPRAMREIIAAEIRAIQWMQDSRDNLIRASEWTIEATEALTGEALPLSAEQYAFIAERDILGSNAEAVAAIRANSIAEGGRLQAEYLFLRDLNKVPAESQWEDVYESFDLTILSDVLDNALEYRLRDSQYGD